MIKIKVKPEDFIVEEVADVPMCSTGDFCVYLLKKRGWKIIRSVSHDNFILGNSKVEILRRSTPQNDTIRHSERRI